jgi:hypothetical protein
MVNEALELELERANTLLEKPLLEINNPFEEEISTSMSCTVLNCGYRTATRTEKFTELSLPLPQKVPPPAVPL